MLYREIGRTGKKASIIGMGCEHLDRKPYEQVKSTLDAALAGGINMFDMFMPGQEVRGFLAKALGTRRKEVMIQGHIGASDVNQQYDISRDLPTVKRYFEDLLRLMGGYIDFGMLFFIDSEEDYKNVFESDIADYAQQLKQKGDIGHIGFSSHNPMTAMKAVNTGLPEMLMFSINPAYDMIAAEDDALALIGSGFDTSKFVGIDPIRAQLYTLCAQKGVGITAMKTLGAGKLISAEHTPFAKPLTVHQCLHYALSRPAVASVLPGCQTAEEVADVLRYFELSEAELDYTESLKSTGKSLQGVCVYCSHCQPCPAAIDIATVNKYLDIAKLDTGNIPPSIKSHYKHLSQRGSDCVECGNCEERCPFGVPIIANMKKAEELLNKD